jgi:hypothetical protein
MVEHEREMERYEQAQKDNIADFERLVKQNMDVGAKDRAEAIQWLIDAEEDEYMEDGYFRYLYGIPAYYDFRKGEKYVY